MKEYSKCLFVIVLVMILIPITVFAEEKYEFFDFKVEEKDGEKIIDTNIGIYASISNDTELTDKTSEFDIVEKKWNVCIDDDCDTTEEVGNEDLFEPNKEYILMIKITAKNGNNIGTLNDDKIKINGTTIKKLDGDYDNDGKELIIKSRTSISSTASKEIVITPTASPTEKNEANGNNKCLLGFSFCCTEFLGLSICIWIIIVIAIILLIISIFMYREKKKTDEQLAQL